MAVLLNLFLDISLLRKGPQDVPASEVLLRLTLVAYLLSGWLVLWLLGGPFFSALLQALVDLGLLSGLSYVLLFLAGYPERYPQTLTALAGTGTLLGLVGLPILAWLQRVEGMREAMALPSLFYLLLLVWNVALIGHILRHALSCPPWRGVAYALGYLLITMMVMGWLFSPAMSG
ncbi:MAG TPA: hypothetical protein VNN09_03340 [Candidatus Competibacteraceae bacterium]|nr:hypothetical protein [Candidatus Competibacteraceae bacterium]